MYTLNNQRFTTKIAEGHLKKIDHSTRKPDRKYYCAVVQGENTYTPVIEEYTIKIGKCLYLPFHFLVTSELKYIVLLF